MQLLKKQIELTVIRNSLDNSEIESFYGSNLIDLLKSAFKSDCLPSCVEVYHQNFQHKVTPKNEKDVDNLLKLQGKFYAVVVPHGIGLAITGFIFYAGYRAVSALLGNLMPKIPTASKQPPSPNNRLAQRTNRERLGGRVPDIFGQVWAYPDLIAPTYSVYIDNEEVEYSLLCLGRGDYEIHQVRDNKTLVEQIAGTTVQIFPTNKGFTPSMQIGNNLTDKERFMSGFLTERYSSVNGQDLPCPDNYLNGDNLKIVFQSPNIIKILDGDFNFNANFNVGDDIKIEGATDVKSANNITVDDDNDPNTPPIAIKYGFDGNYKVQAIDDNKTLRLENPQNINPSWQKLIDNNDSTLSCSPTLSTESDNLWQGWFYLDMPQSQGVMFSLIAHNGLYVTSSNNKRYAPLTIDCEVQVEQLDDDNNPIANSLQTQNVKIQGRLIEKLADYTTNTAHYSTDEEVRKTSAKTFQIFVSGKVRFRIRRITRNINKDPKFKKLAVSQNVKIKDLYAIRIIQTDEFADPDTTRISVKTKATEGALSIKQRKLNLLVTRKVRRADRKTSELIASKKAEDIIYHIATDSKIGNLSDNQIDTEQIIAELALQRAYFGTDECAQFCHTFDQNNISSEETLQTVAQAVFCQLYRYNNKLRLHFERPQPVGVAIFNSHNMLPNSYERSESFGVNREFDGVIVKYASPKDDAQVTAKTSENTVNPDEKTLVGVRNKRQALVHMWRIWHKHLYSYKTVHFDGADESNIIIRSQRIEVADQLRANVMQGIVTDLTTDNNQIVMTLSEPINEEVSANSHTIFIQMTNGFVDNMQVIKQDDFNVILPRLPLHTISTSFENVVQATYQLVANHHSKKDAYIVTSKEASEGITNKISAINYDERYYSMDESG